MNWKIAKYAIAVMTTLLALVILWQFRNAIIYVLISLTIAAVMRPLSTRLNGKRLLWRILWIILYIVVFASCGYLIFLSSRFSINEIQLLTDSLSKKDVWTLPIWLEGSSVKSIILNWLPAPSVLFHAFTGEQGQLILPTLFGFVKNAGGIITAFVILLIMSVYWSINQVHFERLWLSLLPSTQRKQARGIWRTVEPEIGSYVRNQIFLSLLAGLLLGIGYWLLGSPYPVFMAVAGAIALLIPVIGAPLALIPPLLVSLLTSTQLSLFTTLYALIVLILLIVFIKPRFFKLKWDNPLPTIAILLVMANAFGVIGIIIAPPISAICQILWSRLVSHHLPSGAAATISDLKERHERLLEKIRAMDTEPIPLIANSMERLTVLINNAEPYLQDIQPAENTKSSE